MPPTSPLICEKCQGSMVATKVAKHGNGLRVIGYTLWVPTLAVLLLTAACGMFVTGKSIAGGPAEMKAQTAATRAKLVEAKAPAAVLAAFDDKTVVPDDVLGTVPEPQRAQIRAVLHTHYAAVVGSTTGTGLVTLASGCGVVAVYVVGVPLFIIGLVLCGSRKVWKCVSCGYVFDRG